MVAATLLLGTLAAAASADELEIVLRAARGEVELRSEEARYLYRYPDQTVRTGDGMTYDLLDATLSAELQGLLESAPALQATLAALRSGQFLQPRPDLQELQAASAVRRFERMLAITDAAPALQAGFLNAIKSVTCSDRADAAEMGEVLEQSPTGLGPLAGTLTVAAAGQDEAQYRLLTQVMFLAACGRDLEPEIPQTLR